MHAVLFALFVCERLIGTVCSVVFGLVLGGWDPPRPVHQPGGVVSVHSRRGGLLDVADGAQRLDAERGVVGDALGLVGPGGRRGEGVVEGVGQRPDRRQQCLQEQGLLGSAGPYVATPM